MSDPAHRGQGVTAPHLLDQALDPIWAHAADTTTHHADSECTVYAFGMPADLPNWDEPRVYWVEMVVCAEFDVEPIYADIPEGNDHRIATDWTYYAYVIDDGGEHGDDVDGNWTEVKPGLLRLWYETQRRQGAGIDEASDNAFRRAVGLLKNPAESARARLLRW